MWLVVANIIVIRFNYHTFCILHLSSNLFIGRIWSDFSLSFNTFTHFGVCLQVPHFGNIIFTLSTTSCWCSSLAWRVYWISFENSSEQNSQKNSFSFLFCSLQYTECRSRVRESGKNFWQPGQSIHCAFTSARCRLFACLTTSLVDVPDMSQNWQYMRGRTLFLTSCCWQCHQHFYDWHGLRGCNKLVYNFQLILNVQNFTNKVSVFFLPACLYLYILNVVQQLKKIATLCRK